MPQPHQFPFLNLIKPNQPPPKSPNDHLSTLRDLESSPISTDASPIYCDSYTKPLEVGYDQTQKELQYDMLAGKESLYKQPKKFQSIRQRVHKKNSTSRRPLTVIHPPINMPRINQSHDKFLQVFKTSPEGLIKNNETQDRVQINIRCFQSKFIRELNFKENERWRKNRRKLQINVDRENFEYGERRQKKTIKPYNRKQMYEMWHNGVRIVSEFKSQILHGETQVYYPNGANFSGKYEQGVRIFGSFDFNNGYVYWGGFLGDKFEGEGQISLPNGKVYSGEWSANELVGKVEIKYPSGDVYYGEVKDFKKHGKGYLFFKTGQKYVGEFDHGNITGRGQYFVDEQSIGRGIWKDGELVKKMADEDEFIFFEDKHSHMSSKKSLQPQSSKKSLQQLSSSRMQGTSGNKITCKRIEEDEEELMDGVEDEPSNIRVRNNQCLLGIGDIGAMGKRNSSINEESKESHQEQAPAIVSNSIPTKRNSQQESQLSKSDQYKDPTQQPLEVQNRQSRATKQLRISFCDPNSPSNGQSVEYTTSKDLIQTQQIVQMCKNFPIPHKQSYIFNQAHIKSSDSSRDSHSSMIRHTAKFNSIGTMNSQQTASNSTR